MTTREPSELQTLLDRRFAGDLSASEHVRIHALAESGDAALFDAVKAADALEELLPLALRSAAKRAGNAPAAHDSEPERDAPVAADLSIVDAYLAGESDAAQVRHAIDAKRAAGEECPAADAEWAEARALENMVRSALMKAAAAGGRARVYPGADSVDRYLAGDLSATEQAELFASAADESQLGIAFEEARGLEALVRDSLRRGTVAGSGEARVPSNGDPLPDAPSLTLIDEMLDRCLAGALKRSELERLSDASVASPAVAARLGAAERYSALMRETLALAGSGAKSMVLMRSARVAVPREAVAARTAILTPAAGGTGFGAQAASSRRSGATSSSTASASSTSTSRRLSSPLVLPHGTDPAEAGRRMTQIRTSRLKRRRIQAVLVTVLLIIPAAVAALVFGIQWISQLEQDSDNGGSGGPRTANPGTGETAPNNAAVNGVNSTGQPDPAKAVVGNGSPDALANNSTTGTNDKPAPNDGDLVNTPPQPANSGTEPTTGPAPDSPVVDAPDPREPAPDAPSDKPTTTAPDQPGPVVNRPTGTNPAPAAPPAITVSVALAPEMLVRRAEAMSASRGELLELLNEDGLFRLFEEKVDPNAPKDERRGRDRASIDARTGDSVAMQVYCLRALLASGEKAGDSSGRAIRVLEAISKVAREKMSLGWLSAKDAGGLLCAVDEMQAALAVAGGSAGARPLPKQVLKDAADAAKALVKLQKDSGLWGEINAAAYGKPEDAGSLSARAGRQIDADVMTTWAALRGIECAIRIEARGREASGQYGPALARAATGLVNYQSPTGPEVSADTLKWNAATKQFEVAVPKPGAKPDAKPDPKSIRHARGWTLTGDLANAKSKELLPRNGAATAAAAASLLICRASLPAAERRRLDPNIRGAVADGMAWLSANFMVLGNPECAGDGTPAVASGSMHSLYLCCLRETMERADAAGLAPNGPLLLGQRAWFTDVSAATVSCLLDDAGAGHDLSFEATRQGASGAQAWPHIRRALSVLMLDARPLSGDGKGLRDPSGAAAMKE
jgi:hypothetical protein